MKSKNLIILAAVVIAVLAYIMLVERHRPTSDEATAAAEKVLLGFESDNVMGIVIERAEGRVRLERVGEEWRLREPFDFPADTSVVSSTLGSLDNLTAESLDLVGRHFAKVLVEGVAGFELLAVDEEGLWYRERVPVLVEVPKQFQTPVFKCLGAIVLQSVKAGDVVVHEL